MEILDDSAVRNVMGMSDAISALRESYSRSNELDYPPRTLIRNSEQSATFGVMPIFSRLDNLFIVKVISHHILNVSKGLSSINGVIVVQEGSNGQIKALLDASTVTSLRTGATAGLATDLLARKDSKRLAVIGTGAQAMAALEAVLCVRDIKDVAVYSRSKENVRVFIERAVDRFSKNLTFNRCKDVRSAIKDADILCTATTCAQPLFSSSDVLEGVHVNAIGKHTTVSREFPIELVPRSILMVEDRETAIREAGNYHYDSISISEMLQQEYLKYQSKTTIFSSVGTAFQDACICVAILKKLKLLEA
ncbi:MULTISPECIES: ornithine cyclodeaminase family protein [unclassified Pseudomonas]|uniref:ornithine cyclodeaminase family protein n=1 Tax=unclassified Pseudomonas TaxID=196821 RepID=UPI000F56850E|nr:MULTISPECIES: ornithine cyclodeaminase family protein [unclassified Pseudomonas]AZF47695.1 Ornithine cyclodeaminase [Pseudomonas sp. R2-7-07]AZF58239.1 Ornithine cyclodeaminase [Pseudomonas sp. R11-23-07]